MVQCCHRYPRFYLRVSILRFREKNTKRAIKIRESYNRKWVEGQFLSEFDFLLTEKDGRKRRLKRQCRYCKYFSKIPDHELKTASTEWESKGICWYRKEVLKIDPVVCKYWISKWNCKFDWKDMLKGGQ